MGPLIGRREPLLPYCPLTGVLTINYVYYVPPPIWDNIGLAFL